MGLFQRAVETYDANQDIVGVIESADQEPLVPVAHILAKATLEVSLTKEGTFFAAEELDKKEPKIIIPVTEKSGGRSGKNPVPHPLCDKLEYIAPNNEVKHAAYVSQLSEWVNSEFGHPMLDVILKYVESGSIIEDLESVGIKASATEATKLFVRWKVVGLGEEAGECWKKQELFDSFSRWYVSQLEQGPQALCMIEGDVAAISENHPKGIFSLHGNAKLISSNDTSGFTYRGRFTKDNQASTVGYLASQKAHNALRWIIAKQKSWYGGRAFICWNLQGAEIPHPVSLFRVSDKATDQYVDYDTELKATLNGYSTRLPSETSGVVIAVFDAATPGRLSVVYYNELMGSDYLQRLYKWDKTCSWPNGKFGIQTPLLRRIVEYAFGSPREEKGSVRFVVDEKLMGLQLQRLIGCRVDGTHMPFDIEQALVNCATNAGRFDKGLFANILFTTCAVIRKYHIDTWGEDYEMTLDENKMDRSYQFGRLLAVFEKVERDTYDRNGKDDNREPNALRMQQVFRNRPYHTVVLLHEKLNHAYFRRLKKGSEIRYKKEIGQIFEMIATFPESERDKPLKDTYLMGYYLERNKLYMKASDKVENQED